MKSATMLWVLRWARVGYKCNLRQPSLISRRFLQMPIIPLDATVDGVKKIVNSNDFVVFSLSHCPYCDEVKEFLTSKSIKYCAINIDETDKNSQFRKSLFNLTSQRTFPNVFAYSNHLGGCDDVKQLDKQGLFDVMKTTYQNRRELEHSDTKFDYDIAVIGGGSGGLACAKECADHGKKVVIFDFVTPSSMGTTWGLGGTCVNVGCIPKKLMHKAAIHGHDMKDSNNYGWALEELPKHDWAVMQGKINNYIRSLNFAYRTDLRKKGIDYFNSLAKFVNKNEIKFVDTKGQEKRIKAKYTVLATGERPSNPEIPGGECCITSDDLFWLKYPPGKTLIVGASYVALECAGALHGMGYDVTVLVRSIFLRGYDQQMAEIIGQTLKDLGVKVVKPAIPVKVECLEPINHDERKPGKLKATYKMLEDGSLITDEFNTVMFAIGRKSCTTEIGLEKIKVKLDARNRVITVDNHEQTETENVFAIGDILANKPQLTPVAIKAGQLLARRLCGISFENCDYNIIPTTVFTPIEYGAIGFSEDDAKNRFGENDIDVFHSDCFPLEYKLGPAPETNWFYAKLITRISQNNKVIGFHVISPNAGEVTQGYAVAMQMGATLNDFNRTIGIHPTVSEIFTSMKNSKRLVPEVKPEGGC